MMKTANNEFITFNEPIIQSYLIDINLFAFINQNNISKKKKKKKKSRKKMIELYKDNFKKK